jgi:hypothetical protein
MDLIKRLQKWYISECNGDWEHTYGVQIGTLDNPGWIVDINLNDTAMENVPFSPVNYGVGAESIEDDGNWLYCEVDNMVFKGRGGPEKLEEIIKIFLDWAESCC